MDQNNQKSLLPDFTANGFAGQFNGLPHGNANALMSTLQSLQMQSMANQMLPTGDLQCDLSNHFLLEQIQLRALYNTINGQKIDPKLPQTTQAGFTLPFPTMTATDLTANPFSSIPSTSGTQHTASQLSFPTAALAGAVSSSLMLGQKLGENLTVKATQPLGEEWMKTICVDSLLDPFKEKLASAAGISGGESSSSSVDVVNVGSAPLQESTTPQETQTEVATAEKSEEVAEKPAEEPSTSALDYDEAHDDVDNIFGLSLVESDVRSNSIFRRQSPVGGLSPIEFTPPDSPQGEMTLDDLFGFTTESKKPKEPSKSQQPASDQVPSTSAEPLPKPAAKTNTSTTSKAEDDFIKNFVKPKNIPVYKQKAALMSLEARESARKDDPNYDAFEFEDDDDLMFGSSTAEPKKEPEGPKKAEPKAKSVYITGVGFEIQNRDKDHSHRRHHRGQPVAQTTHDFINDKTFFSIADNIRTRKDERMACSVVKPEQSTSTDCAKDGRFVTNEEPLLPKFVIRIDRSMAHQDEPITTRKRYKKRKNNSENDDTDSEADCINYRRRKTTKKIYSIHQEAESTSKRYVFDFPVGPCVPDADRKRLSCFGPAEGILPKGTYVVCKADILKEDCAIWRVDNQNLLQKFPPFRDTNTNRYVYRSSSTYSGWCEQISSQYFRVTVKILKQNRSETTIEPEIALTELFIASSFEWFKNPRAVLIEEPKKETIDDDAILTDTKRVSLNTLINAYLTQTFTLNHVQTLLDKNDWTYSRSLSELETNNKQCEALIKKRIPVSVKHNRYVDEYTRVAVSKSSYYCLTKCQICKRKKPRRVIHFFDKKNYTPGFTFENNAENTAEDKKGKRDYPVVDAISCGRCAMAVGFLHQMKHIQLHLLRICEDKLEEIGTSEIDLSSDKMIEAAKSDKHWTQSVIQKYCNLWDEVRFEFRDV